MAPSNKSPSSLDYSAHLHELALGSWSRAMLDDDASRAVERAMGHTRSHEKLWRFVGHNHVALAELASGQCSAALDALNRASRSYSGLDPLAAVARRMAAHVHLEMGAPGLALTALGDLDLEEDPQTRYWRALAHARLDQKDIVRQLLPTLEADSAAHVEGELDSDVDRLREAVREDAVTASPRQTLPLQAAAARALVASENRELGSDALERIVAKRDGILYWPLPYIRSLYLLGEDRAARGRREDASELYRRFAKLWRGGELDLRDVERAAQFSIA